jgi:hypothetical protein
MQFHSFRRAVVIASVMVASVTASQAFAQGPFDVLTGLTNRANTDGTLVSTYTFNHSMILNSIGFVVDTSPLTKASYTLGTTRVDLTASDLVGAPVDGILWYNLANGGLSVNKFSVLEVTANSQRPDGNGFVDVTNFAHVGSTNASSNVTYNGLTVFGTPATNSNLRVSNPSSNVAPEPGSFALALTSGAALLGICIRRRRNAA